MNGISFGAVLDGYNVRMVCVTAQATPAPLAADGISIDGLPGPAAREARIRVRSALMADGRTAPACAALAVRVTIEGVPDRASTSGLDLAIAVAVLRSAGVAVHGSETVFVGELALDGKLRPIRGATRIAAELPWRSEGRQAPVRVQRTLVLPQANAWEAGLGLREAGYAAACVGDLVDGMTFRLGRVTRSEFESAPEWAALVTPDGLPPKHRALLERCRRTRRVMLVGPPGSGKTAVARRLAGPLERSEAVEVVAVHGAAGLVGSARPSSFMPFRAPHHTASEGALVGDGRRPGEVSLAHRGILYLDELPEFRRSSQMALVGALRHGVRGGFPASPAFVVGSANPCPCGYAGFVGRACTCTRTVLETYDRRLREIGSMLGLERFDVPEYELDELVEDAHARGVS